MGSTASASLLGLRPHHTSLVTSPDKALGESLSLDSLPISALTPLGPNETSKIVKSMLPEFLDTRKTDFLVLRSVRFSASEALIAMGLDIGTYTTWLLDPVFNEWDRKHLGYLQKNFANQLLQATFTRNVFLQLSIDSDLLHKRAFNPDAMTPYERDEAREASKRYSAPNIAAMFKALEPDQDSGPNSGTGKVTVTLELGQGDTDIYLHRKAAAMDLLRDFSQSEVIDNDTGEVVQ